MPTKQPRVSPAASPSSAAAAAVVESSSSPSWTASTTMPKKSLRFRRRKRTSSNTVPTYTRSLSSSQLSVDSSTYAVTAHHSKHPKKKSLLKRLFRGTSHSHKPKLVIDTTPEHAEENEEEAADLELSVPLTTLPDDTAAADLQEVSTLEQRGLEQYEAGELEEALETWTQALERSEELLSSSNTTVQRLTHQIKCRLISLHLRLYQEEQQQAEQEQHHHLKDANRLISELEPLDDDDGCALGLEGSSLLLSLLMKHSCWALALQVSHTMPDMDPLVLARLHLEVALEGGEQVAETYHDEEDGESLENDPLLGEKRFQQLSHLSECHQLLLSFDALEAVEDDRTMHSYQSLWQELAQAYGVMGEEELAMGCSQSRLQHLTAPMEVALAHYDQALNVLSPVGQYELALKEAELALDVLQHAYNDKNGGDAPEEEGAVDDDDDVALLWMKLYQFKADVLCRMGRLHDSIQSYETLLQCYEESSGHGPADAANVLYILGKLSLRARRFEQALQYFDQEVAMTKSVVGPDHLAISKILHESARVADAGMMDYPRAVRYYQEALKVESRVVQQCKHQLQQQEAGATAAATISLLQDARTQMGETKQCLGKLHFKMGDFTKAMKTTLSVDK